MSALRARQVGSSATGAFEPAHAHRVARTSMATSTVEWNDFPIHDSVATRVLEPDFFLGSGPTAGILDGFATVAWARVSGVFENSSEERQSPHD
jgi:hypothetical protein